MCDSATLTGIFDANADMKYATGTAAVALFDALALNKRSCPGTYIQSVCAFGNMPSMVCILPEHETSN